MFEIYIVEDDKHIRELVSYALNSGGFRVKGFETGAEFFAELERGEKPGLVLLDIMLPGEDGLEILKTLRESPDTASIPVIMLTAKSGEYDKIIGLDAGADDYITKPFSVLELISRIKAVLRRAGSYKEDEIKDTILTCGEVELDISRHTVKAGGEMLSLTFKEFELLKYLMQNRGIVLSRDKLIENVWNYDFGGESRTVDMHIRTLRRKLSKNGDIIETVRGVGYKIKEG